jgi:hypothetical protein
VPSSTHPPRLQFGPVNAALFVGAAAALGAGYLLLARGSTNLAPILLVVGYCVLLPLGFIL